jgi:transcriptional regulator
MYVPEHFSQADVEILAALISKNSFGTIITQGVDGLVASHLPFLVEQQDSGLALKGHFARANNHWSQVENTESLVIFQGPHCYISPNWYESRNVPTWNYAAVHVYGTAELVTDKNAIQDIVLELSDTHERPLPDPWIPDYDEAMLNAIIGFRFNVSRIQGKYKLSQNKSEADRQGAIDALQSAGSENELAIASLMQQTLENTSNS